MEKRTYKFEWFDDARLAEFSDQDAYNCPRCGRFLPLKGREVAHVDHDGTPCVEEPARDGPVAQR